MGVGNSTVYEVQEFKKPEKSNGDPGDSLVEFTGWKRFLGMGLTLLSSLIFPLQGVLIVALDKYDTARIYFLRFLGITIFGVLTIALNLFTTTKKGTSNIFEPIYSPCDRTKRKLFCYLILRALFGAGSYLLYVESFSYLAISDATVISAAVPVFVVFLARIVLNESLGIVSFLAAVLTTVGVAIISRPPFLTGEDAFDMHLVTGIAYAAGSMMTISCAFICLSVLKDLHYSIPISAFGIFGTVLGVVLSLAGGSETLELPQGAWDWFLVAGFAIVSYATQVFSTLAFKYENAGPIALCKACEVVFSFVWQFVFFGVTPSLFSCTGSLVVLFGVVLVAFRKYVFSLSEENVWKKRLWFMLK